MKLKIVQLTDRGIAFQERLHLTVLAEANLINYVVFDTVGISNDRIVAIPKRAFWFSSYVVRPGDNVILYTKAGVSSVTRRPDGGADHFFFWGIDSTLWNDASARAVLLEVSDWQTSG
jgi:hypothetical protein